MNNKTRMLRYISAKLKDFIVVNVSLILFLFVACASKDKKLKNYQEDTGQTELSKDLDSVNSSVDTSTVISPVYTESKSGTLFYNTGDFFDNKTIVLHYYIPKGDLNTMSFQFIMHGMNRNADDYLKGWQNSADKYGLIIVAPEFSESHFSSTEYNEGMFLTPNKRPADPEKTLFSEIDLMFEYCIDQLELKNNFYNIYGHSAGGQFVHRFMQFYDSKYLHRGVAANPGWYTFPDETIPFPYGIKGLFSDNETLRKNYYKKELTILLGEADTKRSSSLRQTPEADKQGLYRFARGVSFFEFNKAKANEKGYTFNWTTKHVPNVGHDHEFMSPAAADFLYGNK